jgi:hypothetical protein
MQDQEIRQAIVDEEHLKLLSMGYYVSAGFHAAFSLFGLLYLVLGVIFFISGRSFSGGPGAPPPAFLGILFGIMGLAMFLLMITIAILLFLAGSRIKKRESRTFCMVVAGINCIFIPYGTLLSIFTFMVLGRNSVRGLFESAAKQVSV